MQRVEVPASSASFRFSLDGSAVGAKVVGYTSTLEDVHAAIEELEAVSSVINVTHATPRAAGHIAWDITFGQTRRASQHNAASTDAAAIVDDLLSQSAVFQAMLDEEGVSMVLCIPAILVYMCNVWRCQPSAVAQR